ncbi:hypothetical protein CY34DRAFT_811095, partial [Suillus luteus UH-Slu-Lm8-n1]
MTTTHSTSPSLLRNYVDSNVLSSISGHRAHTRGLLQILSITHMDGTFKTLRLDMKNSDLA